MKKLAELVFVPFPGPGHLVSTVEMARLLVDRDDRLSVAVLMMKLPFDSEINTYVDSLAASSNMSSRIRFICLPHDDKFDTTSDPKNFFAFIENQKPHVQEAVNKLLQPESGTDSPKQLAGFVLDMFCTCMMDVANAFRVPSYIFFTSSAAYLGLMLHLQALHDDQNLLTAELRDSGDYMRVPSLINPVRARVVLPSVLLNDDLVALFHSLSRRYRGVKGIVVNSFMELESHAVSSFTDGRIPPVYPVGPILNLKGDNYDLGPGGVERKDEIMTWLDDQPESSVVFLCFGSLGSFREDQVKEIARALEQGGRRFLWSLRRPPKGKFELPSEYTNLVDALPEGFLDRTVGIGKVIGWAPQVTVLGHPSVGGFVSHCGWNSTLESIWFGVPIATWPMQGDQQLNAFQMVKELGLAVEIKMDYKSDFTIENSTVVSAEEIERGIRCLMEYSRKAMMDGGSAFSSMGSLIDDVLSNIS